MVVASFTNIGTEYEVTLQNGQAVSCTCPDHQYRGHKPGHICKHRINANGQFMAEIERAEKFLLLKSQIEHPAPLYSEVCGHLVRRNIHRHCGCMA